MTNQSTSTVFDGFHIFLLYALLQLNEAGLLTGWFSDKGTEKFYRLLYFGLMLTIFLTVISIGLTVISIGVVEPQARTIL